MSRRALSWRIRRSSRLIVAIGLLFGGCTAPPQNETAGKELNFLLIIVDDLRPDLGAYGHPQVRSPSIDRLAATGLRFDRAYSQYPACNPSRASLLTGLRPDTTGVLDNRTSLATRLPDTVTLPRWFRDRGYFTASIGKVFHGAGRKDDGKATGAWDLEVFPRVGRRSATGSEPPGTRGRVGRYSWRQELGSEAALQDAKVARRTVDVLEQVGDRPFLVAMGLTATHPHFVAPARYFDLYPLASVTPPPAEEEIVALLARLQGWTDEDGATFTDRQKRQLIRAYWACVSFVDEQIGRVLAALDRLGLAEDTVVVLVSDHGYHLGEQGWWSKRTLYEASTRVPLILRVPGKETAGQSSPRLVELVDLFPTLADLAGLEPPAGLEGQSLVPLLENPRREWKPMALSQLSLGRVSGRSVRTERMRYTEWVGDAQVVELYDLTASGGESINVAADSAYTSERKRLAALLE